ncbi:CsbD family protein, partial [Brunnivagina elsteri]
QEVVGEVTGNPNDKAEGKAKQAESQALGCRNCLVDGFPFCSHNH